MSEFTITLTIKLDDGMNWSTPDNWDWTTLLDLRSPDESVEVVAFETIEPHP